MASLGRSHRMGSVDSFAPQRAAQPISVRRWDGAARSSQEWDNLRRDPELWHRDGNCLVYLYERGHSQRGPSFKVPFATLIEAKCYPLIERFIAWDGIQKPKVRELARWSHRNPARTVELYIPAPILADRTQAYQYHLAMRNLFAWVFRRSMVGPSLGNALIGLLHSMHEFRAGVDDNVKDMTDYFDEEGYLDMSNQPDHALAILNLAEYFQLSELYTRAFAHCVGMGDRLYSSSEHKFKSTESRKCIRRARGELDRRLERVSEFLQTFLDEELSEAHLSVSGGARAHLEQFRSFLYSFYITKFGSYPPPRATRSSEIFDAGTLRTMREDFGALYDLLVDDSYTASQTMPSMAFGGICTIQLVNSFDQRYNFKTLEHPLPLIPRVSDHSSRRLSWIPGRERMRNDRRPTTHSALTQASNMSKPGVAQNQLVSAYRRFEEESLLSAGKPDRQQEKVSLVDARKVRWILVYAVNQVLRSATDVPKELEQDSEVAQYSLSVSTASIPPWGRPRDGERILRRQKELIADNAREEFLNGGGMDLPSKIEIKPDIDYFALTHKDAPEGFDFGKPTLQHQSPPLSRSNSFHAALSRSSTLRRSMRMFKTPSSSPPRPSTSTGRSAHHEIVVHGYGNGTNDVVNMENESNVPPVPPLPDTASWPVRGDSTASNDTNKSKGTGSTPDSVFSADDLIDSSFDTPPANTYYIDGPLSTEIKPRRQRRREVVSMMARSFSGKSSKKRPSSAYSECPRGVHDFDDVPPIPPVPQRQSSFTPGLPRTFSRHSMMLSDLRRRSKVPQDRTMPGQSSKYNNNNNNNDDDDGAGAARMDEPWIMSDDADWQAMQDFLHRERIQLEMMDDDEMPAWDQYAELGGLTDMR